MNKYYKNTVLCSNLDYHCLLCGESFEDIPSVEKHIRWEKHRKSLKDHTCLPKYKKDLIHKIGAFHYCEICNIVLELDDVAEHIKSDEHKAQKVKAIPDNNNETVPFHRDTNGSIKFPKLTINRLQWHSIDGSKCYLCDDTVINITDHIASSKHMIKLIQSQVIEETGHYYRKIDCSKFYCFNCANILNEDALQTHSCKKNNASKKEANKNSTKPKICESPGMLKLLADIEKKDYEINIKEKTAKCRLCNALVDVTFNALCKHREQYHEEIVTYVDPQDHGKLRADLASYGRENFIKLNERGSKGYCSLCNIYISASIKVATSHVNGARHRGHLELKGLIARKRHSVPGRRVQPLQHFLNDLFYVKPLNSFCVNYSVSIRALSFMFVTNVLNEKKERRKCYCCDVFFKWEDLKEHWETKKHRDAFLAADVLLMEDEFIRIIRPGLFHCGFCNEVFPFWETMQRHLETWPHKHAKQKNELAFVFSVQWVAENKTNGRVRVSDQLYLQLLKLGMLQ